MVVTKAPSMHRATEFVCQFYQQFIYKTFIPNDFSRICTLPLRYSLCRRHLRDIAFTSVHSVTPCAHYISLLIYPPFSEEPLITLLLCLLLSCYHVFHYPITMSSITLLLCLLLPCLHQGIQNHKKRVDKLIIPRSHTPQNN